MGFVWWVKVTEEQRGKRDKTRARGESTARERGGRTAKTYGVGDGAENVVDLANLLLVLEEDLRVEVGHAGVLQLDDDLVLHGLHVAAGHCKGGGGG